MKMPNQVSLILSLSKDARTAVQPSQTPKLRHNGAALH